MKEDDGTYSQKERNKNPCLRRQDARVLRLFINMLSGEIERCTQVNHASANS